jgi:2-polyprenyl-3-methyl-5-hydroxy-6-metoxy-1,4-benzoquinol methylase
MAARTAGSYELKQLASPSLAIRYSHGKRFLMARKLVTPFAGGKLLDYGSGDGTFLGSVSDLFPEAVGTDSDPKQLLESRQRLSDVPGLSFYNVDEIRSLPFEGMFDVITCMEVLEHCIDADAQQVLSTLDRVLAPSGVLVVSVPVEIGPSLLIKQLIRIYAGWRNIGDYPYTERYSSRELLRMLFATKATRITRPTYGQDERPFHAHKGFNWRSLAERLGHRFDLDQLRFSPISIAGSWLASQVWLVCRKPRQL